MKFTSFYVTNRCSPTRLLVKGQKPGGSEADTVGKADRVAELTKRMKAFQAELKKNTRPIGRITEVPEDVKRKLNK